MLVFLVVHTGLMELAFLRRTTMNTIFPNWNSIASITRSCREFS